MGKTYVPTGETYQNKNWTDTDTNGNPMGKLTDGLYAKNGNDNAIGCYQGKEMSVTIDLGEVLQIKRAVTDLYGNASWGISDPAEATVSVSVSEDGKNFTSLGDAQRSDEKASGDWKNRIFSLTLDKTVPARYVRVIYKLSGNFCWSSEIEVFGLIQAKEESVESSVDALQNPSTGNREKPVEKSNLWLYILIGSVAAAVAITAMALKKRKKIT